MNGNRTRWWLVWTWIWVWATACAVPPGERMATAGFDDSTNGLVDHAEPAANPQAGAFFNDGDDKDIRGRSENLFRDTDDDGLPDQRVQDPQSQRLLIQTASMSLEVARPEAAIADFVARAQAAGGYLTAQQQTQVTVRVPAAKFETLLSDLRAAGRVLSESRQAQDVTKQYFDLGLRLDSAKRARERLLALLEKANNVKDMLEIEAQVRRLIEEIERMEGEQRFLADQVAMSTIAATFRSTVAAPPPSKPRRREPSRFDWLEHIGAERVMEGF
ncbi:MAG: DUF4349 domain-containing protein [Planctomycetes bacterium]|nr:DUF4349 domain-containing protein [Planctomycetota bacterium]